MVQIASLLTGLLAISSASALNILLTNDDSWGSANIRAFYHVLSKSHKVLMVAPTDNQSGVGGTAVYPNSNLTTSGLYGLVTPGASYFGCEVNNTGICYFNGTPTSSVLYALDQYAPTYFNNATVDLVVAGPNEGSNLGGFVYTLSGTQGAAYTGVDRGIPSIAFSGGNSTHRSYKTWNANDTSDIANIYADLASQVVESLAEGVNITAGETLLPIGTGLTVNFPKINSTCTGLPFVMTRMTGGAETDGVIIMNGFPTWSDNYNAPGTNACLSSTCYLPSETKLSMTSCSSTISMFSVDYDARPAQLNPIRSKFKSNLFNITS